MINKIRQYPLVEVLFYFMLCVLLPTALVHSRFVEGFLKSVLTIDTPYLGSLMRIVDILLISIALGFTSFILAKKWKVSIKEYFTQLNFSWTKFLLIFIFSIFFFMVTNILLSFSYNLRGIFPFDTFYCVELSNAKILTDKFMIILHCIIAPILEEILFRGLILKRLQRKYSLHLSLLISSLLFASYHLYLPLFLYYFLSGYIFGLVFIRTKSLSLSIILHSLNNIWCEITMHRAIMYSQMQIGEIIFYVCSIVFFFAGVVYLLKPNFYNKLYHSFTSN